MFLKSVFEIKQNEKICIYGAGEAGRAFLKCLKKLRKDIEVVCFLDSNKSGTLENVEIIKFSDLNTHNKNFNTIIVASIYAKEIINTLKQARIENFAVLSSALMCYCCTYFELPKYLRSPSVSYFTNEELASFEDKIFKTKNLLHNEDDRILFNLILNARINKDHLSALVNYSLTNPYSQSHQYLEHINLDKINYVIEGGVFDGYTSRLLIENSQNIDHIYGIDPFIKFLHMGPHSGFLEKSGKFSIHPCALWNSKKSLDIKDCGTGSYVTESSQGNCAATSIDDFVFENNIQRVDLIKLDVEGAEPEVLKGAINTIKSHRPTLAISIYHQKEHLFEIPLLIDSLISNYQYRIGHYSPFVFETVWYAIPN